MQEQGQNQSQTTNWPQSEAAGGSAQYQGNLIDSAKTATEAFYDLMVCQLIHMKEQFMMLVLFLLLMAAVRPTNWFRKEKW